MAASVDCLPGLFEFTDFHQTNTHLYIFGYTSVGERGRFLRVSRALTNTSLEIECDERQHTVESYEKELRKIHESSHSNGGLQPVCKVRCRISWSPWRALAQLLFSDVQEHVRSSS